MHGEESHEAAGILFDFGGTLDSDGEHWLDRFYVLYEKAGLRLPPAEIKRAFYEADDRCKGNPEVICAGLRPLMEFHVHVQFETLHLKAAGAERDMARSFCAQSEQYLRRNALLLQALRDRYRLGVVSNFYGNVAILCEEAGLMESLRVILDSVLLGVEKPDHRIFLTALDSLQLAPSRVVFVGDSHERDIVPAQELGMKTVWLPGPNPRTPLHEGRADARISSLTELPGVVP
jgi:HAD superfamily hydrolase (TIGR01509 family)